MTGTHEERHECSTDCTYPCAAINLPPITKPLATGPGLTGEVAHNEKWRAAISGLKADLGRANQERVDLRSDRDRLAARVGELESALSLRDSTVACLKAEVERLTKDHADLSALASREMDRLAASTGREAERATAAESESARLRLTLSTSAKDKEALHDFYQQQLSSLRTVNGELEAEVERLRPYEDARCPIRKATETGALTACCILSFGHEEDEHTPHLFREDLEAKLEAAETLIAASEITLNPVDFADNWPGLSAKDWVTDPEAIAAFRRLKPTGEP